ncbi:AMP-binding protein [Nocardia sp. NPDC052566]|uniref:AMP-binding protein n=1 Tax=Nocardia sp. NPDC052566 TaxID=3364330 RepID=UPI0037C6B4BF
MSTAHVTAEAPLNGPPLGAAQDVLHRMMELPSLADRYRALVGSSVPDWHRVPILTKDDFRSAFADVLVWARDQPHGAIVLGSGGTTAQPKLSLIPSGQLIDDIRQEWDPLTPDDVLVNYDTPGRLSASHNFYSALAHGAGATTIPLGAVEEDQLSVWLDFIEQLGATALNATQSRIAHLLEHCESIGRNPPALRKLLWNGEAYGNHALEITRRMLPDAELHGIYGSTETWVIGHNGPACALDTFHLMPYQYVELVDEMIVVTNLHSQCLNPVVRYNVGDRGEMMACRCGRAEPALRVIGRNDPQLKFLSILVTPQEISQVALADTEVSDAQVALFRHGRPDERIELRIKVTAGADATAVERRVREAILTVVYRLGFEVQAHPEAFTVHVTDRLSVNQRSGKTPLLVKEDR